MITSCKELLMEIIEDIQDNLGGPNDMMDEDEAARERSKEKIIEEIRQAFDANGKLPKADEVAIYDDEGKVQVNNVGDVSVREVAEEILGEIRDKAQSIIDELTAMCAID